MDANGEWVLSIATANPGVLVIFTIGIQAGPGFFDSFRSKGKTLILITMLIICSVRGALFQGDGLPDPNLHA